MPTTFHVAVTGSDVANGSAGQPFRTIGKAAATAQAGDTVLVHAGEYREWVKPARGGLSDTRRITYAAVPGEHVVIKGSEHVTGWQQVDGAIWRVTLPAAAFGDFNPYSETVDGDWVVYPTSQSPRKHLGEVYLNGRSFYEVHSVDDVALQRAVRSEAVDDWTGAMVAVADPDQTTYVWYAEVDEEATTIWANFCGADPNQELVEINMRRSVFYPTEHHLDYITVRGFELAQAACPWTPPTADQPGLIGPNWAKGWIIEDNIIHDAKCSAISIGKESSTGHNHATERGDKPGYQYQLESVFSARQIGWDEEHIGSHIIRRNTIFDCGQNGIVGHLGCIFSTIEDNHIYNIAIKREFYGYEIAGIKLHAAIDVVIRHNRIHDCSLGTWLDWQTQGTRVSRNIYYRNSRDLFVEVSHGPYLVEHNIFASPASLELFSQGGAFVHNLIAGTVSIEPVVDRPTPYHVPHSTQVAGYAAIVGGDDRHVGNLFLAGDPAQAYGPTKRPQQVVGNGTGGYNGHPASLAEYLQRTGDPSLGDHERFVGVKQPVYIHHNVYAGATPFDGELTATILDAEEVAVEVIETAEHGHLAVRLPEAFGDAHLARIEAGDLPSVRFVDADFEERDGSPVRLDTDLLGLHKDKTRTHPAGPIGALAPGHHTIQIW